MGVATDGTSAYLVGGFDAINAFNTQAFLYDPQSAASPQTATFTTLLITTPYVPLANPAVGWVNGNLVVAPGYDNGDSPTPTTVYVYSSLTGDWSSEATPFTHGGGASAGAVIGSTFYVVAGNTLSAFDLTTDTWTSLAPLPATSTVNWEGVAAINGVLYVVGGLQLVDYQPGTSAVWAYTPADPTQTAAASKGAENPTAHATANKADNRQGPN